MSSEYSPGGSKPRMTKAQIKKLQENQEKARRVAEEKIAAAKQSDEWKKEQAILAELEKSLEPKNLVVSENEIIEEETIQKEETILIEKIIQYLKALFK